MKKLLIWLLPLLASGSGYAQYVRADFSLSNAQGQAISGAQVYILTQPANTTAFTPLATLYGNANGTGTPNCTSYSTDTAASITNPRLTDGFGHACAYLAAGTYTIVYSSPFLNGPLIFPDQSFGTGTGGGGTANSVITFVNALIVTATAVQTNATSANIIVQCKDSSGNPIVAPSIIDPTSYTVTTTFAVPQTGACIYNTSGGTGSGPPAGSYVQLSPTSSQNIAQPAGTGLTASSAGVFGSGYSALLSSIINSANPASIYAHFTTSGTVLDGLNGAVLVPSGSAQYQVDGLTGYVDDDSASTNAVAVGGYAHCQPTSLHCWASNFGVIDDSSDATTNRTMYAIESDVQPQNGASHYLALFGFNAALFAPLAGAYGAPYGGAFVAGRGQVGNWDTGFHCQAGACQTGLNLEQSNATAASNSPDIKFSSYNGTSIFSSHIFEDTSAVTHIQADNGAGGLSLEGMVAPNSLNMPTLDISANYAALTGDAILYADATAASFTITLPATPSVVAGPFRFNSTQIIVFRVDTGSNTLTVSGNGHTINGSSSITLSQGFNWLSFDGNNSDWVLIQSPASASILRATSAAYAPGSLAGGACATQTATTVTGATTGMAAVVTPTGNDPGAGIVWQGLMGAGTVSVRLCNATSGSLTPVSTPYNIRVIQ